LKALTLIFVVLIALLQYPLWLGKGSWLRVWNVSQKIDEQKKLNVSYKLRNDTLRAEVRDLKQGNAAIEERARSELGMIKEDEVFYQVIDRPILSTTETPTPAVDIPAAETKTPTAQTSAKPKE
jgi:cell division protein FtsB